MAAVRRAAEEAMDVEAMIEAATGEDLILAEVVIVEAIAAGLVATHLIEMQPGPWRYSSLLLRSRIREQGSRTRKIPSCTKGHSSR